MPSLGDHLLIKNLNSILMGRSNKSPVSVWISLMPSQVQFQGNGRSESILEDLRQGTVVNELILAIVSTCTCLGSSAFSCCYRHKATLFSILCFLHFKGWGGGVKENRNAAFKSLMCHTVPFKTSTSLCSHEG